MEAQDPSHLKAAIQNLYAGTSPETPGSQCLRETRETRVTRISVHQLSGTSQQDKDGLNSAVQGISGFWQITAEPE